MIKINKFIYIHFTTLILLAVGYINRNLEILLISYSVIFLHELAHLLAAILIGLKPAHIVFFPFGVNLKLKNSLVYSLADEIMLYISGPLLNIILALFCIFIHRHNKYTELFYYNNICHFTFNLLPILPMDGGVILKKILSRAIGSNGAEKALKITSVLLITILVLFEGILLIKSKFNFSILVATIFLTGNIFTNKQKYHIDFTKELLFYKKKDKKKIKKVKTYLMKENGNYKDVVKNFAPGRHYIVFKENHEGRVREILTEREIIEKILN